MSRGAPAVDAREPPAASRMSRPRSTWQAYGGSALLVAAAAVVAWLMVPYVALANIVE